jgi:glycosyltransferase involved in cell wall biosynthesis
MSRNILMLHSSSDMYGASKIFLQSIKALQQAGHSVVVVLSESGPLLAEVESLGVEVYVHKLGILRRKYYNLRGLVNRAKTLNKVKKYLEGLIKEKNITHMYSNTSAVLAGALISSKYQVQHIWHLHEIILTPKWFVKWIGKIINKNAHQVVVVSAAVKENWITSINQEKIRLIHNGIDYLPFLQEQNTIHQSCNLPTDKIIIGMVGRINHWKGQGYFLEMAHHLVKTHDHLHFVIVGDAYPGTEDFVKDMKIKIEQLELSDRVSFLGFRKDIPAVLKSLDIFVLPSTLPDPFPTVILEAMASEIPVVATAHGGSIEMIEDGKTGCLIPWDNALEGAKKISYIITDNNLRSEMGKMGRERVLEMFSTQAFDMKFSRLFN